ncbi:MAG: hypothetical protein U9P79_05230 [Candidatus Cloacimonadota bacterium]|nr:hypothetical protein [Candidatus Cloacimonadota bacterium]
MIKKILAIILIISGLFLLSCDINDEEVGGIVSIEIPSATDHFIWQNPVAIEVNSTNIENVEGVFIFIDDVLVIEDYIQPFGFNWSLSNVEYGNHIIEAKAFYDNGTEDTETTVVFYTPCPIFANDLTDFAGITETDIQGNLIGTIDSTDWHFGDSLFTVTFGPAYPNPVSETCFIPFDLDQTREISMIIINSNFEIVDTLLDHDEFTASSHYKTWTAPPNVNDIYRCIFHISDSLHWHGDILAE